MRAECVSSRARGPAHAAAFSAPSRTPVRPPECPQVPDEQPERGIGRGRVRGRRETPLELAERIGDAYGLVLLLIIITFVVMMTLPPEGWGGRVAAITIAALTAIVAFTSSDVRRARVRLAVVVAGVAVAAAALATAISSDRLLGLAFGAVAIMLAIAAATILRRVIVGAREVDFRTILGAISVFTLLGLLFAFLYFAFSRWSHDPFFAGHVAARSSDYLFFSYTTLTTTGYGNLVPDGTLGQSFAVLEMLVGQIFLVTLVAGLVSLWRPGRGRTPARGTDA
jgi:voltage-gated potassium channel Kch